MNYEIWLAETSAFFVGKEDGAGNYGRVREMGGLWKTLKEKREGRLVVENFREDFGRFSENGLAFLRLEV